jgi:hypothetical protein
MGEVDLQQYFFVSATPHQGVVMSYTTCKCIAFSLFVIAFLLSASSIVLVDDLRFTELDLGEMQRQDTRVQDIPVQDRYALTTPSEIDIQLEMPVDLKATDVIKP